MRITVATVMRMHTHLYIYGRQRAVSFCSWLIRLVIHLLEFTMEEPKTKSVLVTYLERNKILKIPVSSKTDELKFLEKEFRNEFKFESNVNLLITFQHFDGEWDEYVDLDEDCALAHKDKLKAVVSPMLITPPNEISEVNRFLASVHA